MKSIQCTNINRPSAEQLRLNTVLTAFICLITVAFANGQSAIPEIPKEKQTSPGLYVTAREAYEMWKANPGKVKILDVRTL